MTPSSMLKTGIAGTVVTVLCCFTPLLVVVFGVIGVSAWLAWADFVLFPALAFFLMLTGIAWARRRRMSEASDR